MDIIDIQGLDITALTNPKKDTDPANQTSAKTGSIFPVRDTVLEDPPVSADPAKPADPADPTVKKDPIDPFKRNTIEVRDEEGDPAGQVAQADSPVKAIAGFLKEKGVIDFADEELRDEDDFISEAVSKSISKGVEEYKNSLPEEIKNLVNLYEDGVPLGALLEKEREIFEYSQVDPEKIKDNKELQKTLVNNFYAEMGWDPKEIVEKIQELEDSALLEKEATRGLTRLVAIQKQHKADIIAQTQAERKQQEVRYKEQIEKLNTTLKNTKEFIAGIPVTEADRKAVFEGITKFTNGKNKVMEFLEKSENYILVSYVANALKGDLSKLKKVATTQAVQGIEGTVNSVPKRSAFSGVDTSIIKKAMKL